MEIDAEGKGGVMARTETTTWTDAEIAGMREDIVTLCSRVDRQHDELRAARVYHNNLVEQVYALQKTVGRLKNVRLVGECICIESLKGHLGDFYLGTDFWRCPIHGRISFARTS